MTRSPPVLSLGSQLPTVLVAEKLDTVVLTLLQRFTNFDCFYSVLVINCGVTVVTFLWVGIDNCYVVHFQSDGITMHGGHETFIWNSFLSQHMTSGSDPGERGFMCTTSSGQQ